MKTEVEIPPKLCIYLPNYTMSYPIISQYLQPKIPHPVTVGLTLYPRELSLYDPF
jgi:hypothetical protein